MAILTGLFTLGRDAELRVTNTGDSVATLALAYNYGRRDQGGNQPTQWVRASLWGKRAESLAPHLVKGKQLSLTLDDLHVREFDGSKGKGFNLEARVVDLEFTRGQSQQQSGYGDSDQRPARQSDEPTRRAPTTQGQGQQQRQRPPQNGGDNHPPPQRAASGFDDMDDDIPF